MSQTVIPGNPFNDADAVAYANAKTEAVIKTLSLKEKVGQMNTQGRFYLKVSWALIIGRGLPLMKIGRNRSKNIPPAIFMDGPRGVVRRGHTNFPCAMARAAMWNIDVEQRIGETMGVDALHTGANLLGAPCMNILRNPLNGRAQEAYGEDPYLTGAMASALVRGAQSKGVMATLKHYALNSIENSRFVVDVKIDKRTLQEVYLPHFKMAIDAGAASVMSAYNKVNGKYCDENDVLLNDILRKQWNYKGFVHSDWILGTHSTEGAIKAGMNVEMPNAKFYKYRKIQALVEEGKLTEQDIDTAIRPTMFTKFLFQYYQNKTTAQPTEYKANSDLVLEAAQEATVLLKNDKQILPLDISKITKLAIVGFLSDKKNDGDHGSSFSRSKYVVTPLQAFTDYLRSRGITVTHDDGSNKERLVQVCTNADAVIIVAGVYHTDEGEYMTLKSTPKKQGSEEFFFSGLRIKGGGDREQLSLYKRDLDVIETATVCNRKCITMLIGGSAITVEEWKDKVQAITYSWYHGMEGARAMPQVIFGEVNPSGKLPFTIPVNEKDLPEKPFAPESIVYDYYHGYTLFDKKELPVAYHFGYGLSYTLFDVGRPTVAQSELSEDGTLQVSVLVKNAGQRAGKEVVQVYIGTDQSKVDRPVKLLRAFKKIALQPGEEQTVTLSVPVKSLAYFDADTDTWVVEKTGYTAYVGDSSYEGDLESVKFSVK